MNKSILLVEDNEDDVFFMQRALKIANITLPVNVVEHGQEAIDYLAGTDKYSDRTLHPIPTIVFLDLKLPFKSGHEVLEWIRQQSEFTQLPVVVLSSSEEPADLNRAYKLGCNSYLVKPPKREQLLYLAQQYLQ
jgi:CheY-like chemotaxis protein